jgi:hypothetical protein
MGGSRPLLPKEGEKLQLKMLVENILENVKTA